MIQSGWMIELCQVSKRLQEKLLLSSVNLTLGSERTHVLLGSSGSGKTTLLRLIAGLIPADEGQIRIDGAAVVVADPNPFADRLGYMVQEGGLFPHLSAADNVTLVARVRGWPPAEIQKRLEELGALVGLDGALLQRYPSRLSGGQRQRVALIRALFLRPRIVLLDEPLGALDPIIRRELQATLKLVFASLRTTAVLVTHDVGEAAFFGDTVSLLHQGRILQHGSFADLVKSPSHPYVTEFLMAQRPVPQLEILQP